MISPRCVVPTLLGDAAEGDTEAIVSMHDVGQALGFEKTDAGKMAEALYSEGYAELKTLSGGIGITSMGLQALPSHQTRLFPQRSEPLPAP